MTSVDDLTPDQRRQEIVAILARGILRLRRRINDRPSDAAQSSAANTQHFDIRNLDVHAKTVLSGRNV